MSRCLRAVLVSLGVGQAASVQVEQRTSSSASVLSQRDSRLVPQRLGAEEALLVSRKFQQLEEQFNAALNNDACAPGVCAPAAELTLGSPTTWFSSADVENLKVQSMIIAIVRVEYLLNMSFYFGFTVVECRSCRWKINVSDLCANHFAFTLGGIVL